MAKRQSAAAEGCLPAGGTTLGTTASGTGSVACGASGLISGYRATTAIGHHNPIAFGAGVGTARVNRVAIGNTTNTYTLAGIA